VRLEKALVPHSEGVIDYQSFGISPTTENHAYNLMKKASGYAKYLSICKFGIGPNRVRRSRVANKRRLPREGSANCFM
jgi:hypothetical protein